MLSIIGRAIDKKIEPNQCARGHLGKNRILLVLYPMNVGLLSAKAHARMIGLIYSFPLTAWVRDPRYLRFSLSNLLD